MRTLRAITSLALIGCGLGLAQTASADVVLLTQERSVTAFNGTTTRSSIAEGFSVSANRLFSQSSANGYWNGAAQYSTFLPDGSTGIGQSVFAEGSVRSEVFGTVARTATSSTESRFSVSFRADTAQTVNVFISTNASGTGLFTAALKQGATTVWSMSGAGNENVSKNLTVGAVYTLEVIASSTLTTTGSGGHALYNLGVGFTVPGPSAVCMVALSAFLRRRRT
jgi:hypothetical protein